jgi:uncharacterized GH25 family protein
MSKNERFLVCLIALGIVLAGIVVMFDSGNPTGDASKKAQEDQKEGSQAPGGTAGVNDAASGARVPSKTPTRPHGAASVQKEAAGEDATGSAMLPPISGRIHDADGPIAGAVVTLIEEYSLPLEDQTLFQTTTDGDGRFSISRRHVCYPENCHLHVSAPGRVPMYRRVSREAPPMDVLLGKGKALRGRIMDDEGKPVPGARVLGAGKSWRDHARSLTDGTFVFPDAPATSPLTLTVSRSPYAPASVKDVTAGAKPVRIRLEPGTPVKGRIVDARTGQPVAGAAVSVGLNGGKLRIPKARTDGEGLYAVRGLPSAMPIMLYASAPGYSETEALTFIAGDAPVHVNFPLFRLGSIHGKVVDGEGNPVLNARVYVAIHAVFGLFHVPKPEEPAGLTDESGAFTLPAINAGWSGIGGPRHRCRLRVNHPSFMTGVSGRLEPIPGEALNGIVVRLEEGHVLAGEVRGSTGKPIAGATVTVSDVPSAERRLSLTWYSLTLGTDDQGRFVARKIPADKVHVKVRADGFVGYNDVVTLPAEGSNPKVFALEPERAKDSGR